MKSLFYTILGTVLLCCTVPLVLSAQAQSPDAIRGEIDTHNAQIEALNKEIAEYEKQLVDIGEKKQTLQSTLDGLDISRKQITARINVLKNRISTIELEIRNLTGSIEDKEASIQKGNAGLAQAINRLYEADQITLVEHVLGSDSISTLWNDIEENQAFQDAVTDHIHTLKTVKEELTIDRDETQKKRTELEVQRKDLTSQQTSLDINRREQKALLDQTKSKESNYQDLLAEKRAAKEAFEQALNELESKLEYTLDPSHLPPAGKGILRWPLSSVKITQYFGNTEFARSGAYSGKGHNGVDFRAAIGTPVKSSLTGTVQGTGNSDLVRGCYSYGKWVLVKHNNGLATLYAHLSQISVVEGQEVSTGEVIGYSGNTGYSTGPHLHFSVYAANGVRVMKLGESTGRKTPCANATIPVAPLGAYLNPMDYL